MKARKGEVQGFSKNKITTTTTTTFYLRKQKTVYNVYGRATPQIAKLIEAGSL